MRNNLKAPPPSLAMKSNITSRDVNFCDMYLLTHNTPAEIYQMTYGGAYTTVDCTRKVGALMQDPRIKRYLEDRERQLNEWYFGKADGVIDNTKPEAPKSVEEIMAKNQSRVLEAIQDILQNTKDPNYPDVLKLHIQKMLKDIEMDRIAEAPMRYLPESCSACRYRVFVEGECTDECQRCKYKKFGEEEGLHYDHKTQLEDV